MQRYELHKSQISDDFVYWFRNGEDIFQAVFRKKSLKMFVLYWRVLYIFIHIVYKNIYEASKDALGFHGWKIFEQLFFCQLFASVAWLFLLVVQLSQIYHCIGHWTSPNPVLFWCSLISGIGCLLGHIQNRQLLLDNYC